MKVDEFDVVLTVDRPDTCFIESLDGDDVIFDELDDASVRNDSDVVGSRDADVHLRHLTLPFLLFVFGLKESLMKVLSYDQVSFTLWFK